MFNVGDKAVYPAHGVGVVSSIEQREIFGTNQTFYILKRHDCDDSTEKHLDSRVKIFNKKT
jgi:RNA polymerase-interacting CarD/CdnL/TRCF family regulator